MTEMGDFASTDVCFEVAAKFISQPLTIAPEPGQVLQSHIVGMQDLARFRCDG